MSKLRIVIKTFNSPLLQPSVSEPEDKKKAIDTLKHIGRSIKYKLFQTLFVIGHVAR